MPCHLLYVGQDDTRICCIRATHFLSLATRELRNYNPTICEKAEQSVCSQIAIRVHCGTCTMAYKFSLQLLIKTKQYFCAFIANYPVGFWFSLNNLIILVPVSPQRCSSESRCLTTVTFHLWQRPQWMFMGTSLPWHPARLAKMASSWSPSCTALAPGSLSRQQNRALSLTPPPGMPAASPVSIVFHP